jgi:membrane-bound lytic murein transglycosylase A
VKGTNAAAALEGFAPSRVKMPSREDVSGLTRVDDWRPLCAAARDWRQSRARAFFAEHFTTVRVGDGRAYVTDYFEPEIAASHTRRAGFELPVSGMPSRLVRGSPDNMPLAERSGWPLLGRCAKNGRMVLHHDRVAIEDRALARKARVITGWMSARGQAFVLLPHAASGCVVAGER